jgi:hypothetical protein
VVIRNFGLEVNRVRTAALVPYADMLNHYRPRETKWTFDNSRQVGGMMTTTMMMIMDLRNPQTDGYCWVGWAFDNSRQAVGGGRGAPSS